MEYRLKAFFRGDEKAARLRESGRLPGILYNRIHNEPLFVELKAFDKVFRQASIHHVITLEMPDGTSRDALVRQVELDKRLRRPSHVDFYLLSDEPVDMYVPLKFVGIAAGVRLGGVLGEVRHDVQVRVVPKSIPDFIEVNVSAMKVGDSMHLSDLLLPEGIELITNVHLTVATVVPPEDVESLEGETVEEEVGAEPEVIKRGKEVEQ